MSHHHRKQQTNNPNNNNKNRNISNYGPGDATYDDSFHRPRRPNPDTIQYLKSLPLDERAEQSEYAYRKEQLNNSNNMNINTSEEEEVSEVLTAAQNALEEVHSELASLAGDEIGSQRLETIAKIACTSTTSSSSSSIGIVYTRMMLAGMMGYYRHLVLNRYGSHVVQTLLTIAAAQIRTRTIIITNDNDGDNNHNNDDDHKELQSLEDLILQLVEELSPYYYELSVHVCGSHVLRSLLCVLAGVSVDTNTRNNNVGIGIGIGEILNPVNGRSAGRGKKSKKKKAAAAMKGNKSNHNNANGPDFVEAALQSHHAANNKEMNPPPSFHLALQGLTERVMNTTNTNHNNSNSSSSSTWNNDDRHHILMHPSAGPLITMLLQVLVLESYFRLEQSSSEQHSLPLPTFAIDSTAEYLVSRMLEWENKEEAKTHIMSLCMDSTASHFIEAVLKFANDSFIQALIEKVFLGSMVDLSNHSVGNFVVQSLLSNARSKSQAELLSKELLPIFGDLLQRGKQGVIWRLTEMAAKFRTAQESIHKKLCESIGNNNLKVGVSECIPKLIQFSEVQNYGGRVSVNPNGCKIVLNLLRFVPRLCEPILNGILDYYSSDELSILAKDSLGSRCVIDGILDGNTKDGVFQKALQKLLSKIGEDQNWSNLAVDRVGQHTVKKIFNGLVSHNDKAVLVAELAQSKTKLAGNNMGRSVLDACAVHEFLEGEAQWKAKIEKIKKEKSILDDILMTGESGEDGEGTKKRKRKRKAKGSANLSSNETEINRGNDDHNQEMTEQNKEEKVGEGASIVIDVLDLLSTSADKISDGKKRKRRKKKHKDN